MILLNVLLGFGPGFMLGSAAGDSGSSIIGVFKTNHGYVLDKGHACWNNKLVNKRGSILTFDSTDVKCLNYFSVENKGDLNFINNKLREKR